MRVLAMVGEVSLPEERDSHKFRIFLTETGQLIGFTKSWQTLTSK